MGRVRAAPPDQGAGTGADTAQAQTVGAVTAEVTALRRLERDIHDGPQQRLVRLAMELARVARVETVLDLQVVAQLLASQRRDGALGALSARERGLLALMAEWYSNAAIAQRLVLSASAVEKHIGNIFAKLGLPSDDAQHRRMLAVLVYLRA
jgi:ATP/maltotriose-dependent transcriptional regulator MalT